MPLRAFITFLTLCLTLLGEDQGSSKWFYRVWQTEDGLPDNSVSAIGQSAEGYLWIGTNGGVIRFNGDEFTPLPLRDIPDLPSRQVHAMTLDRSGQVWMGMERGPIIRIGENTFKVFNETDGIVNRRTHKITEDLKGRIWIAYSNFVCLIEGDKVTQFTRKQGVPSAWLSTIDCDADGTIWLSSNSKIGLIEQGKYREVKDFEKTSIKITPSRESGLWITHDSKLFHFKGPDIERQVTVIPADCDITTLVEDSKGAIWIGTRNQGLFRFHENKLERAPTSHLWITCISEDNEGNIWAGTNGGGLNLILPRIAKLTDSSSGLPLPSVRSTCTDSSGRIWATSLDGQLAYKDSQHWHLFENLPEGAHANCVASDSSGQVWVGTLEHGLLGIGATEIVTLKKEHNLASNTIRSLLPGKNGDLWIATNSPDQLHHLRGEKITRIESPIQMKPIRAMAETSDGTIWIGTSNGHLLRIEDQRLIDESEIDGSTYRSIRTLHATPDGSLWIGYAGDGLGHLKTGTYQRFTTEDGLHDDYLSQIQHDEDGNLWIASNRGLFRITLDNLLSREGHLYCQIYGRDNGLPSIQPSRDFAPSSASHQNGLLFFSTHSGLLEVDTGESINTRPPPQVHLESITISDNPIALFKKRSMLPPEINKNTTDLSAPDSTIELPAEHDNLVISFSALNFTTPENTLIRYRLHPIDEKWQVIDKQRRVTFPRLPAGDYRFQVIASNGTGNWSKGGASVNITVKPFFWETWWFKFGIATLTALVAGGLVYLGLRRKHQTQLRSLAAKQALEQERSRIARDIHDDLGASLTRISLLSQSPSTENNQPQSAMGQIRSTTRDLMRSMDGVVWAISPENDHFDDLANYLSSYAQEFLSVANIRCRLNFPVDLQERKLSAQLRHNLFLAFKEALNNIVKYARATEVRISLEPDVKCFLLKIQDNGNGIASASPSDRTHAGNGMANMEERMKEIEGTCHFQSSPEKGTLVEFKVPFSLKS
ncbi:MAG: two-component regulator propeller domain-containing protein [Akkermansiaceae bacterium]